MSETQTLEALVHALGGTVQTVAARKGFAILYYSSPDNGRPENWDELHIRLDRPATILIAVFPAERSSPKGG